MHFSDQNILGNTDPILSNILLLCYSLNRTFSAQMAKVQSCKLYNNKYMIASTQITNTEIFAFVAVLVFKLLSRKVLFINRKNNGNCWLPFLANFMGKLLQNF